MNNSLWLLQVKGVTVFISSLLAPLQVGSSSQSYSLTSPLPRDDTSQAASPDAHPVGLVYQQHQQSVLQDMLFQQQPPLQETIAHGPSHQHPSSINISPECRPTELPEPVAGTPPCSVLSHACPLSLNSFTMPNILSP